MHHDGAGTSMNIKKSRKPGQCAVVRCTAIAADLLCETHEKEWTEAGKPTLTSAEPGTAMAKSGPLPQADRDALDAARHELQTALARVQSIPLQTQAQMDRLGEFASAVKGRAEEYETKRKSVVGPINASVKEINSWFKPISDTAEAILKTIKDRIGQRLLEIQHEKDAALKLIAANGGEADEATILVAHAAPMDAPRNFTAKRKFEYSVSDASLVPEKYWTRVLNRDALQAEVDRLGMAHGIPGIVVTDYMAQIVRKA